MVVTPLKKGESGRIAHRDDLVALVVRKADSPDHDGRPVVTNKRHRHATPNVWPRPALGAGAGPGAGCVFQRWNAVRGLC